MGFTRIEPSDVGHRCNANGSSVDGHRVNSTGTIVAVDGDDVVVHVNSSQMNERFPQSAVSGTRM